MPAWWNGWRWPWRTRPGMCRIGGDEFIRLHRVARRVSDLEEEIRESRRRGAEARAELLLADRLAALPIGEVVAAQAFAELPLTSEGDLHETAFLALVDALRWHVDLADDAQMKR